MKAGPVTLILSSIWETYSILGVKFLTGKELIKVTDGDDEPRGFAQPLCILETLLQN